jgi:hypothetical protein
LAFGRLGKPSLCLDFDVVTSQAFGLLNARAHFGVQSRRGLDYVVSA